MQQAKNAANAKDVAVKKMIMVIMKHFLNNKNLLKVDGIGLSVNTKLVIFK